MSSSQGGSGKRSSRFSLTPPSPPPTRPLPDRPRRRGRQPELPPVSSPELDISNITPRPASRSRTPPPRSEMSPGGQGSSLSAQMDTENQSERKTSRVSIRRRPNMPTTAKHEVAHKIFKVGPDRGVGHRRESVIIENFHKIAEFDETFYTHLMRCEPQNVTTFRHTDPSVFSFLCKWMSDTWEASELNEEGRVVVSARDLVKAALITERFRCPNFWEFNLTEIVRAARRTANNRRFILEPTYTVMIYKLTIPYSPLRKVVRDAIVWRPDLHNLEDFQRMVNATFKKRNEFQNTQIDLLQDAQAEELREALRKQFEFKEVYGERGNPLMVPNTLLNELYRYPPDFESSSFPDPLASPEGETNWINNSDMLNTPAGFEHNAEIDDAMNEARYGHDPEVE